VCRDAASTPCSAECKSDSLTGGYKSKFPLFHKHFLSGVENFAGAAGNRAIVTSKVDRNHKKAIPFEDGFRFFVKLRRELSSNFFQSLLVDIKICVNVLHIVTVFERFHQADHLCRLLPFQLDVGVGNHGHAR